MCKIANTLVSFGCMTVMDSELTQSVVWYQRVNCNCPRYMVWDGNLKVTMHGKCSCTYVKGFKIFLDNQSENLFNAYFN